MTHAHEAPAPMLSPEAAGRLAEFARAFKAAARAVSLYPGGHPAIGTSLARLAQLTAAMTAGGPLRLQITADTLLAGGAAVPRPDPAIGELAELLHRHLIGGLTLQPAADGGAWRAFLLLLARAPEDVRRDGGIAQAWMATGQAGFAIEEIDYAEVLRDKQGTAAAIDQVMAAALAGRRLELDESGAALLLEIVGHPERLAALIDGLRASAEPHGAEVEAAAFLTLLKALAEHLAGDAARLEPALHGMSQAAGRLSADAMRQLLLQRGQPGPSAAGGLDAAALVAGRMEDGAIAGFVAGSVARERGATERLAHAFQALVPDVERQRRILALAGEQVAQAEANGEEGLEELWTRVEGMLASYSDESYVSDQYARELSSARTQAVDVAQISDDPPERIAAWLATVADDALRALDRDLVLDLLRIEEDPQRWRDIADTVAGQAEDLVRAGDVPAAAVLADVVVAESRRHPGRRPYGAAVLERLARGPVLAHYCAALKGPDAAGRERLRALCAASGPGAMRPLVELLAADPGGRLWKEALPAIDAFGDSGRAALSALTTAPRWEVRRVAAALLRELAGGGALREIAPLLADPEPRVQREAVQALVGLGGDEAPRLLLQAMAAAPANAAGLLHELSALRDERAAALLAHVLRQVDRRRQADLHLALLDALGAVGTPPAVEALREALHDGDWRAPLQTRRTRAAAAGALRRIGSEAALEALRHAAGSGRRGVRAAARLHLGRKA